MTNPSDPDPSLERLRSPASVQMAALTAAECWARLGAASLARLAMVTAAGVPELYPVNYTVFDGLLLMRTANDDKLRHLRSQAHVALEIDGEDDGMLWSVVVHGIASQVVLDADKRRLRKAAPDAHSPHEKPFLVKVEPTAVTGRRFSPDDGGEFDDPLQGEASRRPSPIASRPPAHD